MKGNGMGFRSDTMGIPVIDTALMIPNAQGYRGYERRDRSVDPEGGFAKKYTIPTMTVAELKEVFEERERKKLRIFDRMKQAGAPPLYQYSFSNCWANGIVDAIQCAEVLSGRKHVPLSATSVSGPVKGYQDVGGWGIEALKYAASDGVAEQKFWPANSLSKSNDNAASRASRAKHKVLPNSWIDLPAEDWLAVFTCLARGFPCSLAHMEWQHLVNAIDGGIHSSGELMALCRNSGYGRDSTGHSWVRMSFGKPDEALAITTVTAA